jgi:hypothetical protein
VEYYADKTVWVIMIIFTEFLRALDASKGVQSREILLFVDGCGAHTQDMKIISEECCGRVLSTELHKRVNLWIWAS